MSIVLLGSSSGSVTLQEPAVAGSTVIDLPATSGTMAVLPTATSVLPEASGGTGTTIGYNGFKNRIINGAMVIDQRNAGASVTPTNTGAITYTLDRIFTFGTQASKFSVQQNAGSVTPPNGFTNYVGITSLSAYSVVASDEFAIGQRIEGFNVSDLGWGTANAQTVTLSFWVRSSLTGTFGGAFRNATGTRAYPFSYTISSANTWEQKIITVSGDTTGTWVTTSGIGINLTWGLGCGSTVNGTAGAWAAGNFVSATGATSVVGTNGATFYITGVQLEKGSTATSFDYRPYGTELALCQRYLYAVSGRGALSFNNQTAIGVGAWDGTTGASIIVPFPVQMRTYPTSITVSSAADFQIVAEAVSWYSATAITLQTDGAGVQAAAIQVLSATRDTRGYAARMRTNSSSAYLGFNAEL
jgi:hypothetical protein